ncbi:uncharacterized [Tachysurus ichikawai]
MPNMFRERVTLGVFGLDQKILRHGTCTPISGLLFPSSAFLMSSSPPPPGLQYHMFERRQGVDRLPEDFY